MKTAKSAGNLVNNKLIFLDFDGVCNNFEETPGSYVTHAPSEYGMCVSNMARIKALCEKTGARIVISSNWRKFSDADDEYSYWHHARGDFQNPIRQVKDFFGDLIVGQLPKDRHMNKAFALTLWLEDNSIDQQDIRFCVFDDDLNEGFQYEFASKFILVDPKLGVTDADIEKAEKLLI